MKRARHSDLFVSAEDAELYAKQAEMARNVSALKSKKAKVQQVTLLVNSLVKRLKSRGAA